MALVKTKATLVNIWTGEVLPLLTLALTLRREWVALYAASDGGIVLMVAPPTT